MATAASQPQAVVIGPGRVGRALSSFYKPPAILLNRQQQLPADLAEGVPVWVATTNDGLDSVLQHTAPTQRQQRQLIFIQNGMLLPWLQQHGLQENTQVLLYMSASGDGRVTDGLRTCVCGPWSRHVADTLAANGVCCAVVEDWRAFHQLMLVKLLWSCIFWLLSAGLGGKPVGVVAQQHAAEVSDLVAELLPLGQQYLRDFSSSVTTSSSSDHCNAAGVQQNTPSSFGSSSRSTGSSRQELSHAAVLEQLLSYSVAIAAAVPSVDMARRECAWRNGFFLGLPQGRTPLHCDWLVKAGCKDLLLSS